MDKSQVAIFDPSHSSRYLKILSRLESSKLTPTGHGYESHGAIPIGQSAIMSASNYSKKAKKKSAIALLSVILAANRSYNNVVKPNLDKIEKENPELNNFEQLKTLLRSKSQRSFYAFWGHKDKKKYDTLCSVLDGIDQLRIKYPQLKRDFDLMNKWGKNADLSSYSNDIIGRTANIGVATFQHLRMVFGIDTVKPDQRVKEVLANKFNLEKLSDLKAIKAVQELASMSNKKAITIDQILVKYGSSYYNRRTNKLSTKAIAKNFKDLGVAIELISKATLLPIREVRDL